jgi:hypothetical protein
MAELYARMMSFGTCQGCGQGLFWIVKQWSERRHRRATVALLPPFRASEQIERISPTSLSLETPDQSG